MSATSSQRNMFVAFLFSDSFQDFEFVAYLAVEFEDFRNIHQTSHASNLNPLCNYDFEYHKL